MSQTVGSLGAPLKVSAAQQWVNDQIYDVMKAASNPNSSVRTFKDILRYGTSEAKTRLSRNPGVPADILESLVSNKCSMAMMRWIAENPNASSTTLSKVAFHNRDPITLLAVLKHKNLPLSLAERYLPTISDYDSDSWLFGDTTQTVAANKVVSFELLLKHINYYHDEQIDHIVKARHAEFFELIKPYRARRKDAELAMAKLINVTLFGTPDADVVSDWYGQLLTAADGNTNAIEQLKKSAKRWL
jgi:hypothetical protein